jgi:hypothetical protein
MIVAGTRVPGRFLGLIVNRSSGKRAVRALRILIEAVK